MTFRNLKNKIPIEHVRTSFVTMHDDKFVDVNLNVSLPSSNDYCLADLLAIVNLLASLLQQYLRSLVLSNVMIFVSCPCLWSCLLLMLFFQIRSLWVVMATMFHVRFLVSLIRHFCALCSRHGRMLASLMIRLKHGSYVL